MIDLKIIDNTWTLFLDRDGVINHEKHNDYIHTWDEFEFYEGVLDAMAIFAETFKHIVVVTNQRGIGRGLTQKENVETIHTNMVAAIQKTGGRVDAVYYCPEIESENRKPNSGMGLHAAKDFPTINLDKSIMVGNTSSDMQFGRNLGVKTIFLPTTRPEVDLNDERIDAVYQSLIAFANALKNLR